MGSGLTAQGSGACPAQGPGGPRPPALRLAPARLILPILLLLPGWAAGQPASVRGFVEARPIVYASAVEGTDDRVVVEGLARVEGSWRPRPWLRLIGGVDFRAENAGRVEPSWTPDWDDRGARRPRLSLRRFSAAFVRGGLTLEVGRQFVRWGKADVLNPTDRFAPRDFLTVVDSDFLGVTGARVTWERGADTVDLVWAPHFTPSRVPLPDGRWSPIPAAGRPLVPVTDGGAVYPGRGQAGVRWNHLGRGYEASVSFFDGFSHLPLVEAVTGCVAATTERCPPIQTPAIVLRRAYPSMRMVGGDVAVPLRWVTLKAEAGHFSSRTPGVEEYAVYVIQAERQVGEWQIVAGYAGDLVSREGGAQVFAADRGLARSIVGRLTRTIDARRSAAVEWAMRQDGAGSWLGAEYSQSAGSHWRLTVEGNWIRGRAGDFLGQYRRNSHLGVRARCSF